MHYPPPADTDRPLNEVVRKECRTGRKECRTSYPISFYISSCGSFPRWYTWFSIWGSPTGPVLHGPDTSSAWVVVDLCESVWVSDRGFTCVMNGVEILSGTGRRWKLRGSTAKGNTGWGTRNGLSKKIKTCQTSTSVKCGTETGLGLVLRNRNVYCARNDIKLFFGYWLIWLLGFWVWLSKHLIIISFTKHLLTNQTSQTKATE
jgi:hypothetical protein